MSGSLFELAVERHIAATPEAVYAAWIGRLAEWWAPKPWVTHVEAFDPRPGGAFSMVMSGPDGASSPIEGVFLEVVANERVVFTNAFRAGWIPQAPFMVGLFTFAPDGEGTHYRAAARHWDEATMRRHEGMGFAAGWAQVAGQLAALAEGA